MGIDASATPWQLNGADFRALAKRALHPLGALPQANGRRYAPSDFDLNPELAAEPAGGALPAAVLVPVVDRAEPTLLLTLRTEHLPAHAGQIAFPGGKVDPDDSGPLATALREAMEEIGLADSFIEPLGFLDDYRTGTGFRITPVVALVDPAYSLALNADEVVDAFEVPLPFLMDARNHQIFKRTVGPRERQFYAMAYGERFIWGATAGILKNMHERLFKP